MMGNKHKCQVNFQGNVFIITNVLKKKKFKKIICFIVGIFVAMDHIIFSSDFLLYSKLGMSLSHHKLNFYVFFVRDVVSLFTQIFMLSESQEMYSKRNTLLNQCAF